MCEWLKTNFSIAVAENQDVTDQEITELLNQVYVEENFTSLEEAKTIFAPASVRQRGVMIVARDTTALQLAGFIIVVPYTSSACRMAKMNESEMHLLGVKPQYRQVGLGRALVNAAIEYAVNAGFSKMFLWTQTTMTAAQNLYESVGFVNVGDLHRNGRDFMVYEKKLALTFCHVIDR